MKKIPAGIWTLVSLLMDLSSEMIHSLLPVFMVSVLNSSPLAIGLVEGLAEATALITKVFSGPLSDYWGRRKGLALLGYAMGALSKPLFALASSSELVLLARFTDRVGKGIRGAPRDAMVADLAPPEIRGAAFGLRQSLDTLGAFGGPLLAAWLMWVWSNDFRSVFWVAVVPGFFCVTLLQLGIEEPEPAIRSKKGSPFSRENLGRLPQDYWKIVCIGVAFTLARFSEAFLVLKGHMVGIPIALTPLVMVAMNFVYSISAYPFGKLADRIRHQRLLLVGLLLLVAADALLAVAQSPPALAGGLLLWGLHMGATQGLLAAMVAQVTPSDLRGTGYGLFNLMCGCSMLLASGVAGFLWSRLGPGYTFGFGALSSALATLLLLGKKSPA